MISSLALKTIGVYTITYITTELCKVILLYLNLSLQITLIIGELFRYLISNTAQYYVFQGKYLVRNTFLKLCSLGLVSIQCSLILLYILENNTTIQSYLEDNNISDTIKKIYKYLLINISIVIVFLCIDYPLRNLFIFNTNNNDYLYCYILISIAIFIYLNSDGK